MEPTAAVGAPAPAEAPTVVGMAHPVMFDDADPVLARLREICLALPEAQEKVSHGRPSFFTTKVFASYGGTARGDKDREAHSRSLLFVPDAADRPALLEDGRFYEPAYLWPSGWLGLDLASPAAEVQVDWTEVAELVDASYRLTASARLVRLLDDAGGAQ
ncbi:MAG: phosphoribosylglycinamide formyltransferase [Humibacillus sp.]|nr:phosphoribosylglycinamide formyltransferase [Humibacillus sp.]